MTDDEYRARYLAIEADFHARAAEVAAPHSSSGLGCSGRYWHLGEVIRNWPAAELWRSIEAEKASLIERLDSDFYGGLALENAPTDPEVEYDSEKLQALLKSKEVLNAHEFNELAKIAEIRDDQEK